MQASEVIEALAALHAPGSTWTSDEALATSIEAKLKGLGVRVPHQATPNGGRPELLVDSVPNLLLAISASGVSRTVGEVAAQLYIRRASLPLADPVAVLGSSPEHVALREMLMRLDIILVVCS